MPLAFLVLRASSASWGASPAPFAYSRLTFSPFMALFMVRTEHMAPHMVQVLGSCGLVLATYSSAFLRSMASSNIAGPVEALACASHAVVPIASARNAVRQVGGVCGNFRGDNALAHVLHARQAQVLGGSHVAQEVGRRLLRRSHRQWPT